MNAFLCDALEAVTLAAPTKTIAFLAAAIALSAHGAEPQFVDQKLVSDGKIDIRPEFPAEAQAQRLEGSGVFILHLQHSNGRVRAVEVQKSTGHKILDDAAISKFMTLQFNPQTVASVKIPIEFKMPPTGDAIVRGRGYPATIMFFNERPVMPSHGRTSTGK